MRDISQFDLARAIIKSPAFSPLDMRPLYQKIGNRTGIDFSATIRLCGTLPPFLGGTEHQDRRKAMAAWIAASKGRQRTAIDGKLDELVDARFSPGQSCDLLAEFARPLWRALSTEIIGSDAGLDVESALALADDIPMLFSPTASIAKRRAINDRIQAFIDADAANADTRLLALCSSALGSGPFVGSFALSIYRVVEAAGPVAARLIDWPATFPESGLEFIERVANERTCVAGTELADGESTRNFVRHDSYSEEQKAHLLFGVGAHACIGKPIAQHAWAGFVSRASRLDVVLRPVEIAMESLSVPFFMPKRAVIAAQDR